MMWRILWPLLLAAALALISANFLVGLPGAFFIDALLPRDQVSAMGPGGWAAAVYVSFIAPFGAAPALWARQFLWAGAPWWGGWLSGLGGYMLAGAAATLSI